MDTERSDVDTRRDPEVVVSGVGDRGPAVLPEGAADDGAPVAPRRELAILLGVGLALVVALTLALALWTGRDGDVVATPGDAGVDAPAVQVALRMSVEPPATVTAGEEASFTVRWTDDEGVFSGTSEEWGDGVGTSSLRRSRCEPGGAPAGPAGDAYAVTHTWSEPGTYAVVLGVATYTCEAGTAVEEDVSTPVTVEVLPAR